MNYEKYLKKNLINESSTLIDLNEGDVTISGLRDSVAKLKTLKQSLGNWLQAADTLEGTQRFMTVKSAIVNLKKVADAIDKADVMDKKYRSK